MDKGSLENKFKAMKMPGLKKFLQDRGIMVNSYLRPGLVAIACAIVVLLFQLAHAQYPPRHLMTKISIDDERCVIVIIIAASDSDLLCSVKDSLSNRFIE